MMNAKRRVRGIALSLMMVAGALFGHEGHEHKILGTVTMAADDHVIFKTKEGREVTVNVTADTKITKGKEALKTEDLKAGTRIVVTAVGDKEPYTAKKIEMGEARKSSKNK